jgi:hypothetical protein
MPGIPKIVLERLRAKSAASSGAPPGLPSFQGAEHPDANLLAAFAEKTLSARERGEVLAHLAQCAACREVVTLTVPEEVEEAEPARVAARRGWNVWPALRWGALAAALGVVAIVVVVHEYPSRRQAAVSTGIRPAAVPAEGKAVPQTSAKLPPVEPSAEVAAAKSQAEERESRDEMAKLEMGATRSRGRNVASQPASAETKQHVTLMAAARPPAAAEAENAPPVPADRETSTSGGTVAAGALPVAPPPAEPAFRVSAAHKGEPLAETRGAAPAGGAVAAVKTESATAASDLNTDQARASSRKAIAAPAPQAAAQARVESPNQELAPLAVRSKLKSKWGRPTALWTISASGKVERSEDGAKTWQEVPIDDAVTFRVVTASGTEVWAGGSGGALFHSSDGGANWQRVKLESDGTAVVQAVVGIRVRDPQHLTVTTASGEQWVSEDGGRHWQREL